MRNGKRDNRKYAYVNGCLARMKNGDDEFFGISAFLNETI